MQLDNVMEYRKPPFAIDRSRRGNLAGQIADGLRQAVVTGFYKPGEGLPPIRAIASMLDVGRVNVERAITQLTSERLISPRPHVGSVVCGMDGPLWKGLVLIVVRPGSSIQYLDVVCGALRDELTATGYLFQIASVPRNDDGTFDFSLLSTMLRQRVDLVVQLHDKKPIAEWISRQGVPFARFTADGYRPANCVGVVRRSTRCAEEDFVRHCREKGVKSVLQISAYGGGRTVAMLKRVGIRAEEWRLEHAEPAIDGPTVAQLALDSVKDRLEAEGRSWLPEVLFLSDDYLATGAMVAFLEAGVRIPEDVRVVTRANKGCGCGPVFTKPFTRMEVDTVAHGAKVAECVSEYLRTGRFPTDVEVGPVYVRGETF